MMQKRKSAAEMCFFPATLAMIYRFLVCLLALSLGSGCEGKKAPQKLEKVSIGLSATSFLASLVHIAKAQDYFLKEGIDLEIQGYPAGKVAFQEMFSGEVDLATVADVPIVFQAFERDDFRIISTIVDTDRHAKIVARRDRNIAYPRDLIGRKIATTIGTTAHFYMASFFMLNNLDINKITLVNMKPKEMVDAIVNGEIDAFSGWEPQVNIAAEKLGDNGNMLQVFVGYRATFNLVGLKSFVKENPKRIEKVLRALHAAEIFARENRQASIEIVANSLQVRPETIDPLWDKYDFRLSLSQALVITFEDQAHWASDAQLVDKTNYPDFLEYFYLKGLNDVVPEAVTIIR